MVRSRTTDNETNNTNGNGQRSTMSMVCVYFFMILILAGLAFASVYFKQSLIRMNDTIVKEESMIKSLQEQLSSQQITIERFNSSVTNTDIQRHVNDLEQSLHRTQQQMMSSLAETTEDIQLLLNSTVERLDETVTSAQAEINHEVDLVKSDVAEYVRTTQDQFSMENSFMVYQLAGTFTLIACLISMWHMTAHIRRFKRPFVQRKVLAILWMSPIYGITSWLSLVFPKYEVYLGIIKDFYEAYVIYQFLSFLISVLGKGNREIVVDKLAHHADHLEPPMRLFGWCRSKREYDSPRRLADDVLLQCQVFAMQFVFLKPITAVASYLCNKFGWISPNGQMWESPNFWINVVQNLSVFFAFSGLLKFYHAVQDDLIWCRPFPKFLCIKGIVFMTFWQGLVISILARTTGKDKTGSSGDDPDIWAKQAQNFLICLEMLLFSIAHFYCFPTEEWEDNYQPNAQKKVGDNMAFGDFYQDLKLIMSGGHTKKKGKQDSVGLAKKNDDVYDETNESSDACDEEKGSVERENLSRNESDDNLDVKHIKSTLEKSLIADNYDVREAASRLLPLMDQVNEDKHGSNTGENDNVSSDAVNVEADADVESPINHGGNESDSESAKEHNEDECSDLPSSYGTLIDAGSDGENDKDDQASQEECISSPGDGEEEDDSETPSETTSLLGNDGNNVKLRPSIWNTED